jgi:hypothetical protein
MNRAAMVIGSASFLAVFAGALYIVDCRGWAKSGEQVSACWLTGLPIMGIGGAGAGGFRAGYNTFNPLLRGKREEEQ